mgnify:CR=1 FL=1
MSRANPARTSGMNPLSLPGLNAVVVGNGGIGSALCQALLERSNVGSIALLGRSEVDLPGGERILQCHVDAQEPGTLDDAVEGVRGLMDGVHLLVNTVGVLHGEDFKPEKRLRDLRAEHALNAFQVNAMFMAAVAQAFSPLLRHGDPALFASISARVGSLEDNELGGWYSYRASKAAHNMLLRTIAREWKVSHRNTTVVALHPGTVKTRLSQPFVSPGYRNRVLEPAECADALLAVMGGLTQEDSGQFYDWQGTTIPW